MLSGPGGLGGAPAPGLWTVDDLGTTCARRPILGIEALKASGESPVSKKKQKSDGDPNNRAIATNRKARFEYEIETTYEAGLQLQGSEVKSLRAAQITIGDGYVAEYQGELYLHNVHINEYPFAHRDNHEPTRPRKLLLHRREIDQIAAKIAEKGMSVVPIRFYFKGGRVKVELGVGKGKKTIDKRDSIRSKDDRREMRRLRD